MVINHVPCPTGIFLYRNVSQVMSIYPSSTSSKGPFKMYVTVKIPIFDPPPPLSPFVTVCLDPLPPPCHHPNSDKLFDPKLAEKSLGLCLTEHIRMPKSHTEWHQKSRINKKTMFYVLKTFDTVVSKSEKF